MTLAASLPRICVIGLLAVAAVAAAGCRRSKPAPGSQTGSIMHGGVERTFLYHVPESPDPSSPPMLIIGLHGASGDGVSQEHLSGLTDKIQGENIVAVYPDGIDKSWADGRGTTDADSKGIDDVGFISALIDEFTNNRGADPKRVFVIGMSNGSMMTNRVGCELASKVAAIGAVAGTMPEAISPTCAPARRIPVMMFHGTEDTFVPYEGGELGVGAGGKVLSAEATRSRWAEINGCAAGATSTSEPDTDPKDGTTVRRDEHEGCADGAQVVFFSIEGGGHTWPNGWQYLGEALIGATSKDIDATALLLELFKQHPLP